MSSFQLVSEQQVAAAVICSCLNIRYKAPFDIYVFAGWLFLC